MFIILEVTEIKPDYELHVLCDLHATASHLNWKNDFLSTQQFLDEEREDQFQLLLKLNLENLPDPF